MNDSQIRTNSFQAWFLSARPKTLSGAAVPVMLGAALALKDCGFGNFQFVPAVLCFLFAFIMQIDSNFINDYFDCVNGNDDTATRLGPKRACAEGWITLPAMRRGLVLTTLAGCLVGLPLIFYGGIQLIIVGILCVLFAFLYTTKLSYLGLGDVLVLVFFGIVPVCLTYYVILPEAVQTVTSEVLWASVACGLVIDTLLLVNNYRDRDNDRRDGKRTLVVRIGAAGAEYLYLWTGIVASIIMAAIDLSAIWADKTTSASSWIAAAANGSVLFYLIFHINTWREMKRIHAGSGLNKVLGLTARNMFIFGLFHSLTLILIYAL